MGAGSSRTLPTIAWVLRWINVSLKAVMSSVPLLQNAQNNEALSLCSPFLKALEVAGASISVAGELNRQSTICVSSPLAARLDALQFELGEGPRWQALASRSAIICPDLAHVIQSPWPIFLGAARALGVRSVFSFPMKVGAALVGTVDLCCTSSRVADAKFISMATLMAGRAASNAVQQALRSAEDHNSLESEWSPALRREVHQATGILISQLDLSATDAFSLLQGHVFASGKPIDQIAHDVVLRALVFSHTPE